MQDGGFGGAGSADKIWGFHWGIVTKNNDPKKLGRIRAHVTTLTRVETGWAPPVGMAAAGYPSLGEYNVPVVGASVCIGFIQGDFDNPFYLFGPHATLDKPRPPRAIQDASVPADMAPQIRVLAETENFQMYIQDYGENEEPQRFVVKSHDDDTAIFSMNLVDGSIRIQAVNDIVLDAARIDIQALKLQLNNRLVNPVGDVI